MRKIDLKTGKLEIVFSIFLLRFALEPLFGSVPAADYAVWGLIVLCLVLMVVLMIKDWLRMRAASFRVIRQGRSFRS